MEVFDPTDLALWSNGSWRGAQTAERITGFCFDTRQLRRGDCFVALTHGARDGHDFVAQAVEQGAVAALVERELDLPVPQLVVPDSLAALAAIGTAVRDAFRGTVVGITGSCGKTSTKEMLRLLLGEDRTHATAGNWNNQVGVPMTLFGLEEQAFAVIEAGINEPGEMELLGRMIEANLVVVTHVGAAHLERLQSVERVAAEKAQLFAQARADAILVVPHSVFQYAAFQSYADRAIVLAEAGASVTPQPKQVIHYEMTAVGVRLFDTEFIIHSASAGIRSNAALVIATARELGVDLARIGARMAQWCPDATRGRVVHAGDQNFYIDCYNANPASMLDALEAFRAAMPESQPRGYVLGAMNELGGSATALHREVGQALALRAEDRVWFVGPAALTEAYQSGVASGAGPVVAVDSVEKIKSDIAEFKGALFLKGSRSYALEQLLPDFI